MEQDATRFVPRRNDHREELEWSLGCLGMSVSLESPDSSNQLGWCSGVERDFFQNSMKRCLRLPPSSSLISAPARGYPMISQGMSNRRFWGSFGSRL